MVKKPRFGEIGEVKGDVAELGCVIPNIVLAYSVVGVDPFVYVLCVTTRE